MLNVSDKEVIEALTKLVTDYKYEAEDYYLKHGPDKREQLDKTAHYPRGRYTTGISLVGMNIGLLEDWLSKRGTELWAFSSDAGSVFWGLSKEARRKIWEASGFDRGIVGFEKVDADRWWELNGRGVSITNYVIVKDWDFFEEDLEGILSELEKLVPDIRERWKPAHGPDILYCDNIYDLMEVVRLRLPDGLIFQCTGDDTFAIIAPVTEIRVHEAVEEYYPGRTFDSIWTP